MSFAGNLKKKMIKIIYSTEGKVLYSVSILLWLQLLSAYLIWLWTSSEAGMWLSVSLLAYIFTQYHQKKKRKREGSIWQRVLAGSCAVAGAGSGPLAHSLMWNTQERQSQGCGLRWGEKGKLLKSTHTKKKCILKAGEAFVMGWIRMFGQRVAIAAACLVGFKQSQGRL